MNVAMRGIALLFATRAVLAQTRPTSADSTVVPWSTLGDRPRWLDTAVSAGIRYPIMLREANIDGEVRLEAVIHERGAVEIDRTRLLASTHPMLGISVKQAMGTWRFTPPAFGGQSVSVMARVRVTFVLPQDRSVPQEEVASVETDSTGIRIVLGNRPIPPTTGITMTPTDSIAARVAVLLSIAHQAAPVGAQRSLVCFRWDDRDANVPDVVFAMIRAKLPDARNANACPRTYASMFLQLDSAGRRVVAPPGYVDPVWVRISSIRPWTHDVIVARASTSQGTGGADFACEAQRGAGVAEWSVTCRQIARWVS